MTTGSEIVQRAAQEVAQVTEGNRRFRDLPEEIKAQARHVLVPSREVSDAEVEWCLLYAQECGLSPLNGQIYFMPPRVKDAETGKWREGLTPVTGIAGWRLLAERTGKYEGSGPWEWLRRDEKWVDVWIGTKEEPYPLAARCEVYRAGHRVPYVVPVRWSEFAKKKSDGGLVQTWAEKPSYMLGKCAEVAALRKAFPQELAAFRDTDDPATVQVGEAYVVEEDQPAIGAGAEAPEDGADQEDADAVADATGQPREGDQASPSAETDPDGLDEAWDAAAATAIDEHRGEQTTIGGA